MRDTTIARNYAEALLALARKAGDLQAWGRLIDDVAAAMERDDRLRRFLEAPQISADQKNAVFAKAYEDRAPRLFLRYLQRLVMNRRQMLIPEIANEYRDLVDEVEGRVHAQVTVAKPIEEAERDAIGRQLSRTMGKPVVPQVRVNPNIMGGIIVRIGDRVMDGS
ncbi:MAG: synthase subunit delta, partial [Geminicoccaceae bacterium]|nr:synthase subunit delta [Geminicoccaceae bacterium]